MMVECVEMRGVNSEFLKGIAKIKIPDWGIFLSDVKLFKKNDAYWVSMPTREYLKEGEKKYFHFIQFIDEENGTKVLDSIKKCLIKELEVGKQVNADNRHQREPAW